MSETDHSELYQWRINEMHSTIDQIKRENGVLSARMTELRETLIKQETAAQKDLEVSKESRASQGKRIGALESEITDLKGVKKLLAAVGTLAVVALGALLKTVLSGM